MKPLLALLLLLFAALPAAAQVPATDGVFYVSGQPWADDGYAPRSVKVHIYYPGGSRANVLPSTGLMVIAHNWGGSWCDGASNPSTMANAFNVVAICVDYLQSGDAAFGPHAYEYGLLQAGDVNRALWHVYYSLPYHGRPFHTGRIYGIGASGGGHVMLMANKLAPRTYAGIVVIAALVKLSSDIALGLPGGSPLNARWGGLPPEHEQIRNTYYGPHLDKMITLGTEAHVVFVHGVNDYIAPFAEVQDAWWEGASRGMRFWQYWVHNGTLDGDTFFDTYHAIGNRTQIALLVGASTFQAVRVGMTDFDRYDTAVRYTVTGGTWVVSHQGPMTISFQP